MKVLCVQTRRMEIKSAIPYVDRLVEEIGTLDFDFMLLPEKWLTTAVKSDSREFGELMHPLIEFSRVKRAVIVPGSFSVLRDGGKYNTSPVVFGGAIQGFQDKISLFRSENGDYAAGDEIKTFSFNGVTFAVAVCYDIDFPYFAKVAIDRGAQLILNPSLIVKELREMWYIYVKGRSLENRIPIISVNSASEPFSGGSIVAVLHPRDNAVILEPKVMNEEHYAVIETNGNEIREMISRRRNEDPGIYSYQGPRRDMKDPPSL